MTTLKYKIVKTRKPHRCAMCGLPIKVGAKVRYWAGIYDGDFFAGHAHLVCEHMHLKYAEDGELMDAGEFRREILGLSK
jgi:hypothetical protein